MELNWTTFVLEILNFLVLMWILKRFLYRPVMAALNKRRDAIEQTLSETEREHAHAGALEKEYQNRLNDWNQEKKQLRGKMLEEIQDERTKRLQQLQDEIDSEKEKAASVREHREAEAFRGYRREAYEQSAVFASKLLSAAAGPELEVNLFNLFMEQFGRLEDEQVANLHRACEIASGNMTVISAYPLKQEQRKRLETELGKICKNPINVDYQEDSKLLAGLRINFGNWVLGLNLQDELNGYVEIINEHIND